MKLQLYDSFFWSLFKFQTIDTQRRKNNFITSLISLSIELKRKKMKPEPGATTSVLLVYLSLHPTNTSLPIGSCKQSFCVLEDDDSYYQFEDNESYYQWKTWTIFQAQGNWSWRWRCLLIHPHFNPLLHPLSTHVLRLVLPHLSPCLWFFLLPLFGW